MGKCGDPTVCFKVFETDDNKCHERSSHVCLIQSMCYKIGGSSGMD